MRAQRKVFIDLNSSIFKFDREKTRRDVDESDHASAKKADEYASQMAADFSKRFSEYIKSDEYKQSRLPGRMLEYKFGKNVYDEASCDARSKEIFAEERDSKLIQLNREFDQKYNSLASTRIQARIATDLVNENGSNQGYGEMAQMRAAYQQVQQSKLIPGSDSNDSSHRFDTFLKDPIYLEMRKLAVAQEYKLDAQVPDWLVAHNAGQALVDANQPVIKTQEAQEAADQQAVKDEASAQHERKLVASQIRASEDKQSRLRSLMSRVDTSYSPAPVPFSEPLSPRSLSKEELDKKLASSNENFKNLSTEAEEKFRRNGVAITDASDRVVAVTEKNRSVFLHKDDLAIKAIVTKMMSENIKSAGITSKDPEFRSRAAVELTANGITVPGYTMNFNEQDALFARRYELSVRKLDEKIAADKELKQAQESAVSFSEPQKVEEAKNPEDLKESFEAEAVNQIPAPEAQQNQTELQKSEEKDVSYELQSRREKLDDQAYLAQEALKEDQKQVSGDAEVVKPIEPIEPIELQASLEPVAGSSEEDLQKSALAQGQGQEPEAPQNQTELQKSEETDVSYELQSRREKLDDQAYLAQEALKEDQQQPASSSSEMSKRADLQPVQGPVVVNASEYQQDSPVPAFDAQATVTTANQQDSLQPVVSNDSTEQPKIPEQFNNEPKLNQEPTISQQSVTNESENYPAQPADEINEQPRQQQASMNILESAKTSETSEIRERQIEAPADPNSQVRVKEDIDSQQILQNKTELQESIRAQKEPEKQDSVEDQKEELVIHRQQRMTDASFDRFSAINNPPEAEESQEESQTQVTKSKSEETEQQYSH